MNYDSRPDTYEHIGKVRAFVTDVASRLLERANVHDASKLVAPEVETFDEFTPKLKDLVYGSDEYKACTKAMSGALEHHYAANSHHPENYETGIAGMSLLDLTEMLCDWKAASLRMKRPSAPAAEGRAAAPDYGSDFKRSIALNQERFGYSDELAQILLNTVDELGFA